MEENTTKKKKEKKAVQTPVSRKIVKRKISFDVYFQLLMKKGKAQPHHKAAMRVYAKSKGLIEASEEKFDEIFRIY